MIIWDEETEAERRIAAMLAAGKLRERLKETERAAREAQKEEGDGAGRD